MPSLQSFLFLSKSEASASRDARITKPCQIPRKNIGLAVDHLQHELLDMYWQGVERELPYLLLTFRHWQSGKETSHLLPDEEDQHIHGYDTFIDQVSDISRQFHERNKKSQESKKQKKTEKKNKNEPPSYDEVLRGRGWDIFADMKSQSVKSALRTALSERKIMDPTRRRVRMLLQSAQFLDIDKLIECRNCEEDAPIWKMPASAQMKVSCYDALNQPVFVPQRCSECQTIIRGCTFADITSEGVIICEGCYWATHYGQGRFVKQYKHSCLPTALTPEMSRELCYCSTVRRRDAHGRSRSLWPIDPVADRGYHIQGGMGRVGCGLHKVTDLLAEAKYATIQSPSRKNESLLKLRQKDPAIEEVPRPAGASRTQLHKPEHDETSRPEYGYHGGSRASKQEGIPTYLRSTIEENPYENVQMSIRFGPLIIENGASEMDGVLIASRDPPSLQVPRQPPENITNCLLLTGHTDRLLYSQNRPRYPKRYKAFMKQVVGGAFCDFFDSDKEEDLIDAFIHESNYLADGYSNSSEQNVLLDKSAKRLLLHVKGYLGSRVQAYITNIATRLLDPRIHLEWDRQSNSCQTFCDNLIDRGLFGSLFTSEPFDNKLQPFYLMSFVCRPGAEVPVRALSRYDVPNGLTEEYLFKYHYGRHDDSDIIDSLSEYWTDWGGFEGPIYPYQDVFPWDCTEAYDRYPGNCGDCNVSKHVFAFPFDSWSIASLHLSRGRELYPLNPTLADKPTKENPTEGFMSDTDWFKNRLTILLGQDTLLATAVAMSNNPQFRASTNWLHGDSDKTMDRLKLGGIHRAQPFSHHFEKGAYHRYFVADWSLYTLPLRISEYEKLREWRASKIDIGATTADHSGAGGCGVGVFICGAAGAGCAAGNPGMTGDTCGSGCVTESSGDGDGDGDGGCGGCGG
ncbi:hypothetical protein FPOAC2_05665 [Fusarium poae]|uniref:hypothetical protein n=1 Tax=Fusarium poae TaxID=36050 RepID=UPI001CE9067B|nr:hypothetical protein FPOAC1_005551 [Fusarium poae]KAG8672287.1 hypothetical protein FPOAC1_005551 [Fusarium poae]